jgi:hypothetical protein
MGTHARAHLTAAGQKVEIGVCRCQHTPVKATVITHATTQRPFPSSDATLGNYTWRFSGTTVERLETPNGATEKGPTLYAPPARGGRVFRG